MNKMIKKKKEVVILFDGVIRYIHSSIKCSYTKYKDLGSSITIKIIMTVRVWMKESPSLNYSIKNKKGFDINLS